MAPKRQRLYMRASPPLSILPQSTNANDAEFSEVECLTENDDHIVCNRCYDLRFYHVKRTEQNKLEIVQGLESDEMLILEDSPLHVFTATSGLDCRFCKTLEHIVYYGSRVFWPHRLMSPRLLVLPDEVSNYHKDSSLDGVLCTSGSGFPCKLEHVQERCDPQLVKSWIGLCLHNHECDSAMVDDINIEMLLINCHTKEIVPARRESRWVALSYVWGQEALLNPSQKQSGQDKNALPPRIPQTVQDAIQVTVDLGYQYLWVDEFCIDHEHEAHRAGKSRKWIRFTANPHSQSLLLEGPTSIKV